MYKVPKRTCRAIVLQIKSFVLLRSRCCRGCVFFPSKSLSVKSKFVEPKKRKISRKATLPLNSLRLLLENVHALGKPSDPEQNYAKALVHILRKFKVKKLVLTVTWLSRTLVLSTTSTSISSSLAKRYLLTPTIVSKREKLIYRSR